MAKAMKKRLFDKVSDRTIKVAGFISAIVAIIGAVTGLFGWVQAQFTSAISSQIADFRNEVKASDDAQNLAIMRLELMNLMQNDPGNTVEIEILGKKYFQAGGNSYMSKLYSDYAKAHGMDTSFIVGGN